MSNNNISEYKLIITDFEQLIGSLTTFDTTLVQSCCQVTINKNETTMFNKWAWGKSDLFTSTMKLNMEGVPEEMESISLFIPNVKKFISALKNIGKYYDIKDQSLFNSKIQLSVCSRASYIRIKSPKYNIKFQLSTNAIVASQMSNIEKVLVPSKYGEVVHKTINKEDLQENFLMTASINSDKFNEINDLMATLSDNTNSSIKIQIPEQVNLEEDMDGSNCLQNTLYATISDNQKLVKSSIGNKVNIEFGKLTYSAENYKDICCMTSTSQNFVFLMNQEILNTISTTCKTFSTISKSKDLEIVISKPNLMHVDMPMMSANSKSEIYVTIIGVKATTMF